ncbi:unnamed protein product, partial [marine sediment metagenome]
QALAQALEIRQKDLTHRIRASLHIADQIEQLAPVGPQDRPNAEYPWEVSGRVIAPASYSFPVTRELKKPRGRRLLRLIKLMLDDFDRFS